MCFQKFSHISIDLLLTFRESVQVRCSYLGFKFNITNFDKKLVKSLGSISYIANVGIEFGYNIIK